VELAGRHEFDEATAVEAAGDGRFLTTITDRWNIGIAPNGGYLVSVVLAAVRASVARPDPVAVSAHFPSRTEPGPAEVDVEVLREGGHSFAVARLLQGGETRVHLATTCGDLGTATGPTNVLEPTPEFPPPDYCVPAVGPVAPEFVKRFDLRLTPDTAVWATSRPSGTPEMSGWIRFADGREPDTAMLPLVADAFPPTLFNLMQTGWVPTIEFTVHVRGRPAPGWLQCRFRSRYLIEGYVEEDGEVWDSTGRPVALSRQLARVRG
jgi:acyl-CoA thioesterase